MDIDCLQQPIVLNICYDLDTDLPGPAAPSELCWMLFGGANKSNLMCPSSGSAPNSLLQSRPAINLHVFMLLH